MPSPSAHNDMPFNIPRFILELNSDSKLTKPAPATNCTLLYAKNPMFPSPKPAR